MCAARWTVATFFRVGNYRVSVIGSSTSTRVLRPQCFNKTAFLSTTPTPLRLGASSSAHLMRTLCCRPPLFQSKTIHSSRMMSRRTEGAQLFIGWRKAFSSESTSGSKKSQSYTERVKVILKEYGAVGVIFHTVISLFSLGSCYFLVSSGLDVDKILTYFNVDSSGVKKGASTFAIAYMFHKFLLPLRATITIVSVPVIVRHLRARGWMKGTVQKIAKTVQAKK